MAKKKIVEKYVLITNLNYVTINGVRTNTSALLLEEREHAFEEGKIRYVIRGFGPDPAWPVFDIDVPSGDYELVPAVSGTLMISDSHPEGRPIARGAIMKMKDGPALTLSVRDYDKELNIEHFEGEIGEVWQALGLKVAEFWSAPNMPIINYLPLPLAKAAIKANMGR